MGWEAATAVAKAAVMVAAATVGAATAAVRAGAVRVEAVLEAAKVGVVMAAAVMVAAMGEEAMGEVGSVVVMAVERGGEVMAVATAGLQLNHQRNSVLHISRTLHGIRICAHCCLAQQRAD